MADREAPVTTAPAAPGAEEPTIGKLVVDAFDDIGTLVRHMIELAKSELKVSVRAGGLAIAMFSVAAFLLLMSLVMVSFAAAYFIVMAGLDPAWAFLIVFGGYVLLAVLLAIFGYTRVRKVKAPEKTIAQAQEIPRAFSH